MAETTTPGANRRAQDGKFTPSQTAVVTTTGAMGTAWVLWLIGCIKGHQVYWPDDALILGTAAQVFPLAQFFWAKFERRIGYTPPQQEQQT